MNVPKRSTAICRNHHSVMPFGTLADDYRKKEKVS